jgi:serine protease Do
MSRQSPGQRWSSLVLLALFLSLFLYYGLPALAFRIGQAIEAGWQDGKARPDPVVDRAEGAAYLARASRAVRPAVVRIEARHDFSGGSSRASREAAGQVAISHGCGLLVDRQGWVVTSRRVVHGATAIRVHLTSYRDPFPATLAGSDAGTDLAVLKFDPPGAVPAAPLGEGASVEVGECVMAVGNAFRPGEFVWVGVVNSDGARTSPACCNVHDCIHTTAVNSWNFGGPLLNVEGTVVGINTALREADGLPVGVAVPAATARLVVDQLRRQGQVRRGWLGVFIHKVPEGADSAVPSSNSRAGALAVVVDYVVPGSPAQAGGIEAGDVIFRFADLPFHSAVEFRRRITGSAPGDAAVVTAFRGGRVVSSRVIVGQMPVAPPHLPGEREWGIRLLGHLSDLEAQRLGVDHLAGVMVQDVEPGGRANRLSAHDVILAVDNLATPDIATFCRVVDRHFAGGKGKSVELKVSSSGIERSIAIDD